VVSCRRPRDRVLAAAALAIAAALSSCRSAPAEVMTLDGNRLTIDNRTKDDWSNVEVWLNHYYRITVKSIPAGSRFQSPLDMFIAGFGQRFMYGRMPVKDLRLTATLPDGRPFEKTKQFDRDPLTDALGGVGKPR
jgi:hypothetical protein